jgi:hypothetical protein
VRQLVLEGEHTWIRHVSLESFPRLAEMVREQRPTSLHIGPFEVIDLD